MQFGDWSSDVCSSDLKSLNIFVDIDTEDAINSAIVQIPSLIPRFLTLNEGTKQYVVMVEDVITYFINYLFTGYEVLNTFTFRITRNADLKIGRAHV